MTVATIAHYERIGLLARGMQRQDFARWGTAALCVAVVHVALPYIIANWPQPAAATAEPPAAIMIEMAPMPVAPDTPELDVAVGPQQEMSERSTPSEKSEKPVENTEPDPQPSETVPERVAESDIKPEDLPEIENAEAVLDVGAKKPETEPEKVEETKPPEKSEKTKQSKPQDQTKKAAKATSAPKPLPAPRARTNAAPASGVSSSMSIAKWRGMVVAHMNRHKRYPGSGGGTSSVAFTIDRSGRVLSARLVGSSGSAALDQEAVSLARRASPVPAPPANIGRGSIVLQVPVKFSR
jgi:protein TonB